MKSLFSALILALLMSAGIAHADAKADCEAKAVDKNGKALAGAAKTAKVKKCLADGGAPAATGSATGSAACEAKAVDKNGKKLGGAAKTASMKKCEKDEAAPAADTKAAPAAEAKPAAAAKK